MAAIESDIAKDNPMAAADLWSHIDDQVAQLSAPNYPRKRGRAKGTFERLAHENDIVVLEEDAATVTGLQAVHARQQLPKAQTGGYFR